LFDQRNLAEIEHPEVYPAERLIVCRNRLLAAERARKRESLLRATVEKLEPIRERVGRGTLRGKDKIGFALGKVYNHRKVGKHFEFDIQDDQFEYRRKEEQIAQEAALPPARYGDPTSPGLTSAKWRLIARVLVLPLSFYPSLRLSS
jgi:hypothetical protein